MNFLFTIVLMLFLLESSLSQNIVALSYIERTIASPKYGSSIGVELKSHIGLGGFFQQSQEYIMRNELSKSRMHEREFFGFYMDYPITRRRKIGIDFKVRTGVTNRENFVITPSIHAHYKASRLLSIGAGIGTRAFRPTLITNIKINFGGAQNRKSIVMRIKNH